MLFHSLIRRNRLGHNWRRGWQCYRNFYGFLFFQLRAYVRPLGVSISPILGCRTNHDIVVKFLCAHEHMQMSGLFVLCARTCTTELHIHANAFRPHVPPLGPLELHLHGQPLSAVCTCMQSYAYTSRFITHARSCAYLARAHPDAHAQASFSHTHADCTHSAEKLKRMTTCARNLEVQTTVCCRLAVGKETH